MTDRDRLIELLSATHTETDDYKEQARLHDEYIADHILTNGVIVPPCKVGDKIYVVDKALGRIIKKTVSEIRLTDWEIYVHSYGFGYPCSLFGKTVFLTKEESENVLKERVDNG